MKSWIARPAEVSNLLNPAFCGALVRNLVAGGLRETGRSVDPLLPFVGLPLVLHSETRGLLPRSIATSFHVWIEHNPTILIGLAERISATSQFVGEGISFAYHSKVVDVQDDGGLVSNKSSDWKIKRTTAEVAECLKTSYFVGRWLCLAGPVSGVFANLGIRP